MAFTSSCPKCQKQVLVPEGTCPDAVVQCPICSGEYSLGEILASAPPALIVVHPGSTVTTIGPLALAGAASLGEAIPPAADVFAAVHSPESREGGISSPHRVEPSAHDGEPLFFAGDEVQLAPPAEHLDEVALFERSPDAALQAEHPIDPPAAPFGEALAEPLGDEGHDLSATPGDGGSPWGGGWGASDEPVHEEGDTVGLAEPDQDEGLDHVDFAAITGKAAPGSAPAGSPGDAAAAVEPPKKKKRKREANMVLRIGGVVFFGLLALPCAYLIASWVDHKNDRYHLIYKESEPTATAAEALRANQPARQHANTGRECKSDAGECHSGGSRREQGHSGPGQAAG